MYYTEHKIDWGGRGGAESGVALMRSGVRDGFSVKREGRSSPVLLFIFNLTN